MDSSGRFPGILPVYASGWSAGLVKFRAGEGFWPAVEKFVASSSLAANLDKAMMGAPAPRIWLILHEQGGEGLSAATALGLAAELARRDQAPLVLDCDQETQSLTRWAGREEAEGWIDLARFGTSVLASSVVLPFAGRRGYLLGAGSFPAADLKAEEIIGLLARLRRQADDILLVAPADETGLLWAPSANIRLLCWDRSRADNTAPARISSEYNSAGCPLNGAVGFGVPDAYVRAGADRDEAEVVEDVLAESGDEVGLDPVLDFETVPDFVEDGVGRDIAGTEEWREPFPTPPVPERGVARSGGSSRLFWGFAVAFVIVIAVVGGWYLKYGRVPPGGRFQQVAVPDLPVDRSPEPVVDAGRTAADSDSVAVVVTAAADSQIALAETETDDLAGGRWEQAREDEAEAKVQGDGSTPADSRMTDPSGYADSTAAKVGAELPTATAFDMAPYRVPVGSAGWALHVYSFPDSAGTAAEVAELDRRGFESTVEVVDIPGKGRWWRIYVGSFPSRRAAREAMPSLLEKLRTDWAKPVEF